MSREILNCDAFEWMRQFEGTLFPGDVFTSLPDISELPGYFGTKCRADYNKYKEWFEKTVEIILLKTPKCAIFLQSDVRCLDQQGNVHEFIDKSYLLHKACEKCQFVLLWQKVCYNVEKLDTKAIYQRPNWSHLMCFVRQSEQIQYQSTAWGTPDVFPRGEMIWNRAIGINAALVGVSFLKYICQTNCLVDPFCGCGTVLAVANACGLNGIGCELSQKRCRKARRLNVCPTLLTLGYRHCRAYGLVDGIEGAIQSQENISEREALDGEAETEHRLRDEIKEEKEPARCEIEDGDCDGEVEALKGSEESEFACQL
jgi:hypothetical protein